jgi:AAA ATPase domain
MLNSFSVENYRAFARPQNIEIRPLTLFFGWNSGGKSALVRFLPLLSESLQVAGPPIWLSGDVGRRATWPELVCKSTERANLKFSLKWMSPPSLTAEWEIGGDMEGRWQETKSLTLTENARQEIYSQPELEGDRWTGLAPTFDDNSTQEDSLAALRTKLSNFASQVQWISGIRVRPPRVATYGGGAPTTLSSDGSDAVDHLIAAKLKSSADPMLEVTGKFFSSLGEQLDLDNPMVGGWRVLLHPTNAPQVPVNLCDTGEGYAQVLPVLIALARARFGGPRIVCLEQPELHLHTRAQAELAKLLVESAKEPLEPRILVETHSEVLLTSVQLSIANGKIAADKVRVYWVESRADGTSDAIPVDFDDKGRPNKSALVGAFSEAIQLGQELISKQLPKLI